MSRGHSGHGTDLNETRVIIDNDYIASLRIFEKICAYLLPWKIGKLDCDKGRSVMRDAHA